MPRTTKSVMTFALVAALVGLMLFPTTATAKPTDKDHKVDVCHVTGHGTYNVQSVAAEALPAHMGHGDWLPGDDVPGTPGYEFGEDCTPVLVDTDLDGVPDVDDNCPFTYNPDQSDRYGSPKGDACEDDSNGDGILDVDETHICIHIDGVSLIHRGGANCWSTPTTGDLPNIAIAHGPWSQASAHTGQNNTATADGERSMVGAYGGDNNTATVTGERSMAFAHSWDNNTATVTGDNSQAFAYSWDNNTATVTGDNSRAWAYNGDNNTATVTGDNSHAFAHTGDNNTATVTGDNSQAHATAPTGCEAEAIGVGAYDSCP